MYNYILFDLDGTLTDPGVGITSSVAYALNKYGISTTRLSDLNPFIGPPLIDSFQKYYGFDKIRSREAVQFYREYFCQKGMFENEVYDGIDSFLQGLIDAGKKLYVATSKPEVYSVKILEHFDLSKYFIFIGGSTLDETRTKKSEVIDYVLKNNPDIKISETLMVGDRCHDIIGAKQNGIASCGVLFGYGSREELKEAQANYIVSDLMELSRIILG